MELAVNTSLAHIASLRKRNVWYSVKDGNWEDPSVWMGNAAGRRGMKYPNTNVDDVFINHQVNMSTVNYAYTVGHLYINAQGALKSSNLNVSVIINGNLQCTGTLDFSSNFNTNVVLNGYDNYINNLIAGTSSTITYNAQYTQFILDLPYRNLTTSNTGLRYLTSNTVITGNLTVFNLECDNYDLTVNGITRCAQATSADGVFSKSGPGNLLFVGELSRLGNQANINFSGNPNVEFRGGINMNILNFSTGSGTFTFTTNHQIIDIRIYNGTGTWIAPILIKGAITVTNNVNLSIINTYSTINGDNTESTFINNGQVNLFNITGAHIMSTGLFINNATSLIGFLFNGDFTLPNYTYNSVTTAGTGTKILGKNTSMTGTLTFNGDFDCGTYDLTVAGSLFQGNGAGTFYKTGGGNILIGAYFGGGGGASFNADFTLGNPNLEFRGGINVNVHSIKTGTGTWSFTTNNQNIFFGIPNINDLLVAPLLINGAITVTNTGTSNPTWLGTINGTHAASTFDNRATFTYRNAQQPMQTGVLQTNAATNTFVYGLAGPQDITPGIYRNLTLNNSGVKKLLGNVSVQNTYTLTAPATLNPNGFTLTNP
ncbi:hypothetical protein BC343_16595 [Mucilaginibacter pedocola]|uniref:G8 domain-containing protein n=2 Tax=Mucilaginibacter pedocola TaxID=1792845 RepID=A0A1S9P958_9SPHI|nr:hypothetical protein BC343_16595 [Mucilaginibacter pedocola]